MLSVRRRSFAHKNGYGIESVEFSTAVPPHTLAKAGLSDGEDRRYDGSGTICGTLGNERLVEREHRPRIGRQHAESYRVPTFELAIQLANGSGEVPLQVELKTILLRKCCAI